MNPSELQEGTPPSDTATAYERNAEMTRRAFLQRVFGSGVALGAGLAAGAGTALAAGSVAAPPEQSQRVRRWGMVVDLRRCDGCVGLEVPPQCTQFCIWDRYVPQGQEWLEVFEQPANDLPGAPQQFLPMLCNQCENAPCVDVCPVAATFHTPEGAVLIDQERCIGCRMCMVACPYDRRFFNAEQPVQPDWVAESPYDVRTQIPALQGTVMKCDFCTDKAAAGGLPACVVGCPRGALWYGDLEEDIATNGTEVSTFSQLVDDGGAFRPKEELGTRPRVYYIQGHGQLVPPPSEEREFLKDRLEWPWLEMALASKAPHGGRPAEEGPW